MKEARPLTVSEVAALSGVSVRTLHHYDALGLLSPAARSEAGYRLYTAGDLARLWRILLWRRLGVSLAEIAPLLHADPAAEARALAAQRERLLAEREALDRTLAALDGFLQTSPERRFQMNSEEFKELFDGFDPQDYEDETRARWGESAAYRQSRERTARYGKADWQAIKAEMDGLNGRYLAAMEAGHAPGSAAAQAIAAEHHAHLERWFYDASPQMMLGLAQMWVGDERFRRNIDRAGAGLAAYQSAAVMAWAAAQEAPADHEPDARKSISQTPQA